MSEYRLIPLSGKFGLDKIAKVNEEDYGLVSEFTWYIIPRGTGYATHTQRLGERTRLIYMHRLIMGMKFGDGRYCDHINGDTLDNRRENLREASHAQNMRNRALSINSSSGVKGVSWDPTRQKWRATIRINGKTKYIGQFSSLEEAGKAYQAAARQLFGEFARPCN